MKFSLGRSPKLKDSLKTHSSRRPGWETFTYRYVSEFKVMTTASGACEYDCLVTSFVF
jgi:hypothetical protein